MERAKSANTKNQGVTTGRTNHSDKFCHSISRNSSLPVAEQSDVSCRSLRQRSRNRTCTDRLGQEGATRSDDEGVPHVGPAEPRALDDHRIDRNTHLDRRRALAVGTRQDVARAYDLPLTAVLSQKRNFSLAAAIPEQITVVDAVGLADTQGELAALVVAAEQVQDGGDIILAKLSGGHWKFSGKWLLLK